MNAARVYSMKVFCLVTAMFLAAGCAPTKMHEQAPDIPVFRYEQYVHNEGFRGKFAFESHDIIMLTPDRKKTDSTFKFTGAVLGKLTGEQRSAEIVRLDKDLIWRININKKSYMEYPIKRAAFQAGVMINDTSGETVYVEDCCSVKTSIKHPRVKKVVNGYNAEEVVLTMSSTCQADAGQPPNKVTFILDVWIAPDVQVDDLEAFDEAYAKKVGMDIEMFQAMGEQFMKMYPGVRDLGLMMNGLKGYPILSTLTVEDANYLKKQQEERMRESKKGDGKQGGSPTEMATGFFSKKVTEHEENKQKEEDLKWGNAIWRVSWESRNFETTRITADEFELPDDLKKVEQKENLEGEQGKAAHEEKPAHFVKTACLSKLTKAQLGTSVYPGAKVAHARPYNEGDHNTQWYYAGKNNYRVLFSTTDPMEKVMAFYEKEFKGKCTVTTQQEGGNSFKEAVCARPVGLKLVRTFKMSEKPLELKMDVGTMPAPSDKSPQKFLGFELSVGKPQ
ncbi:MAG TPA: hypothetical protein VEM40_13820 [Nitrospirota bacterium]|nr:hypothetical protein [Nitrospirota bacterium]